MKQYKFDWLEDVPEEAKGKLFEAANTLIELCEDTVPFDLRDELEDE